MDMKTLFNQVCDEYQHTRNARLHLMETTDMDKYENGFYGTEIEAVQLAYKILGFHEVTTEVEGEVHVLIPENGDENFAIATDDFIYLMKNTGDEDLRDHIWEAFGERDADSLKELEDWFS